MPFLDKETLKATEGRYVKWTDGEAREFKLLSIEKKTDKFLDGTEKTVHEITAQDPETGEEKVIKANRSMLRELAKIDDRIKPGSVVCFLPQAESFEKNGEEVQYFSFRVSLPVRDAEPSDF